jgi:hypothetical protein
MALRAAADAERSAGRERTHMATKEGDKGLSRARRFSVW